jgi:metal-responsive CopG/Arc/MetJ family transcriptional regulator
MPHINFVLDYPETDQLDKLIGHRGYRSRSEILRKLVKDFLEAEVKKQ